MTATLSRTERKLQLKCRIRKGEGVSCHALRPCRSRAGPRTLCGCGLCGLVRGLSRHSQKFGAVCQASSQFVLSFSERNEERDEENERRSVLLSSGTSDRRANALASFCVWGVPSLVSRTGRRIRIFSARALAATRSSSLLLARTSFILL